jgi:hypothetical protein
MVLPLLLGVGALGFGATQLFGSNAVENITGEVVEAGFSAVGPAIGGAVSGIKKAAKGNEYAIAQTTTIILVSLFVFNRFVR